MRERDLARDIGKTLVSAKFTNNMDGFWFLIHPDIVVNPFDFVTVINLFHTKTIGMVKELQAVDDEHGVAARVAVMANTGVKNKLGKMTPIGMPVGAGKDVLFATEKEVTFALGMPEMENPVPAGVIEMTNGLRVPVSLDVSYLLGPDTAHVNAAGISGNLKSSYLFFLLQSVYQKFVKDKLELSMIIFNTKEEDLLHIDEKMKLKKNVKKLFNLLDVNSDPFDSVSYFLPRGTDGNANSAFLPTNTSTYSYGLEDVYDRLDLLFPGEQDANVGSILNYIYEAWPLGSARRPIKTWTDLLKFKAYPQEVVAHKSTLLNFLAQIQRFRKSPMFTDHKKKSLYLGKEIGKIKAGDVFVIDIAMISTIEEQNFVVGDVMKSIDELYSARQTESKKPRYVLIFIDEINRFLPHSRGSSMSAVADQVMRAIVAGRSRGTVLFSAQQFKSAVDPALHESTGMHVMGKLGITELSTSSYSMIDESTKMNIVRLNRGELVMVHPAFRHPIKIAFPKAPFRG